MDGNGNFRSPLARPFHLMTWPIWAVLKIYYYKYFLFGQKVEAYMSKRGGWGLNYLSSWRLDNLSEKGRQIILNTTDGWIICWKLSIIILQNRPPPIPPLDHDWWDSGVGIGQKWSLKASTSSWPQYNFWSQRRTWQNKTLHLSQVCWILPEHFVLINIYCILFLDSNLLIRST